MGISPALGADSFAARACHSGNRNLDLREELTEIRWCESLWLLKNSLFLKNAEISVIENV
jgi:hypothetical protein